MCCMYILFTSFLSKIAHAIQVFSYFAEASASLLSEDDEMLNRRTRNLQDITAAELGLPTVLNKGVGEAAALASKINLRTTPMEKVCVMCLDY